MSLRHLSLNDCVDAWRSIIRVPRGAHQIVTLLHNLAILAVIQSKLFPPIQMIFENL
jgi:hypothetical protein